MDKRPNLNRDISVKDFSEFYWLKVELVEFCRAQGLRTTGSKIEINKRIKYYLETGNKINGKIRNQRITQSKFDWQNEKLTTETIVTDNYKNTENVRIFFQHQIGQRFKFNVKFMNWMKANPGKTMKDAVEEWKSIDFKNKSQVKPKEIAPQFEYNRYLRDFLADNPNSKKEVGIKLWKIKKSLRGHNNYRKEDLKLIEEK